MKIPGPLLFGSFAFFHGLIALFALSLAPVLPLLALSLFVVEVITAYDNLIIVLGRRIGLSDTALRLNRMRFLLHAVCIGLLIPVYVGIGGLAGAELLNSQFALSAAFVAAALIGLLGYRVQYHALGPIMPINCYGCLRYAQSVEPGRHYPGYSYSDAELRGKAIPPFASIVTVLLGLFISLWTGWSGGLWTPFVVTALMFLASAFPAKTWGALLTSVLEIFYSGGLCYALWLVAGQTV